MDGINNPCPSGYRLPTAAELEAERQTWSPMSPVGAFNSPLKWVLGGTRRGFSGGALANEGTGGYYWSCTVSPDGGAVMLIFGNTLQQMENVTRTTGASIRCVKSASTTTTATITQLGWPTSCSVFYQPGTLKDSEPANEVQVWYQYTGGNGGDFNPFEVNSTGVSGLTAKLLGVTDGTGVFNTTKVNKGSGYVVFDIIGTPVGNGTASFEITFGNQTCTYTKTVAP